MKKRILALLLVVGMLLSFPMATTNAQRQKKFRILLNGVDIPLTEYMGLPYIEDSRTLVPIRLISESLGYKVDWNEGEQLVTIKGNLNNVDRDINLTIGKNMAVVNGEQKQIDESPNVVAKITKDRTYVPLRFVSENLGATVEYKQTEMEHIINLNVVVMDEATKFALYGNGGEGAKLDIEQTKKEGFILREGETKETILKRLDQSLNPAPTYEAPPAGRVSENWIAPNLSIAYIDPIENSFGYYAPWGFTICSAKDYKEKAENMSYLIELIDDRYVPYQKHIQISKNDSNYHDMELPLNPPKWENFNQHVDNRIVTNMFDYDPSYGKRKVSIITKGFDKLYRPHIGEKVKYRVTFKQGNEEHQYEFTVSYLWAIAENHKSLLRQNDKETYEYLNSVGMTKVNDEGIKLVPVNDWIQIY